uniref:ATP synthase complex subunit 8 n=1 Tax=Gekko gecko TaxID=36310 RepID=D9J333_GEKGE|nr:ATP synthase F0 subunit 8 [Gekko gecko]
MPQLNTTSWFTTFIITWITMSSLLNMLMLSHEVMLPPKKLLSIKTLPWTWPWT